MKYRTVRVIRVIRRTAFGGRRQHDFGGSGCE